MTNEPLLTWKGRRVRFPGDGPETAALKVPAAPLRPGSLFFVPSPLEGWGVDVLLDRLPPEAAVVLYEHDRDLKHLCSLGFEKHMDRHRTDPRIFWLTEDTEQAVQALFRRLPLAQLRRCELLTFSGAWLAHSPRYRQIFARLETGLTRWWSNRMTELHMGPLWVRNLIANWGTAALAPWPQWGDATVLVCGAGVTLEGALPWARTHRANLKIVAADTALAVLKEAGVTPDAVVCLEAQHANLRDFAGWLGADIQLFADLTSFPATSRILGRAPRWFVSEFAEISLWGRWPWDEVPRIPPLGSVGVAAAWVAWRLTDGPVVVAGLDFSYPAGKTHARGAPSLGALHSRTSRLAPVEQPGSWVKPGVRISGSGWLTTPVMEGYAGVMTDQARTESHRTWTWSQEGLPLGLDRWPRRPPTGDPARSAPSPEVREAPSFGQWLASEEELWRTILDDFEAINASPDEGAWSLLETHLSMADYLTFWFPDPTFRRDSDWLIRAQVQVRWALSRLRRS